MSDTRSPDPGAPSRPGVSVVVPAYNAGDYLDACVKSLLGQTLDRALYDVIFVDDGSTDRTGQRLDRIAQQHPGLVRVEHIENSGWPGRPRNLGTDLSDREYVFYCDADDWLLPDALELMLTRAVADRADVLMGRAVGNRRNVGLAIFEPGDRCTSWRETPGVFSTLTCQKMFRREFLREHDVRFDEGKVRLEDFIFMTKAYLRAERISIVGSRPCYVLERRDDGGNLTTGRASEGEYFASVEKIVDIVLSETEPGPSQDVALDRVLRSELVGPLSRPPLLRKAPEVQAEALALGQRLLQRIPESAIARQDVLTRNRIRAIQRGDLAAIVRRIEAERKVALSAVVEDVSWNGDALRVRAAVELAADGQTLRLERDGDAMILPRNSPSDEAVDMTATFPRSSCRLQLQSRDNSETWRVVGRLDPVPDDAEPGRALAWTVTFEIDAHTAAGGAALRTGVWDIVVALTSCGYQRTAHAYARAADPVEPPSSVTHGLRIRPYWGRSRALVLSVRKAPTMTPKKPTTSSGALKKAVRRPRRVLARAVRRRALALAARSGITVTRVRPGVVVLSRSAAPRLTPLVPGQSWLLSRSAAPRLTPLVPGQSWLVDRRRKGESATPQKMGDTHWVVPAEGGASSRLTVDAVGSRGWLVSRPDFGALAQVTLENQTLQHLGHDHVAWLLERYDVDLVVDVGANTGQYGRELRRSGYQGRIASFEPVPAFADAVEKLAASDDNWTLHRMALGRTEGTVPIRVQRTFSSLLPASDYGKNRFGTLREFADKDDQVVDVPLRRLDSVLGELMPQITRADGGTPRVFLKMDTQGFDLEAFAGLGDRADDIVGLQSEVALLLIYDGMPRMPEAIATYEAAGFELSGMYPVTTEPDGRVIEYDCVMVRASAAP